MHPIASYEVRTDLIRRSRNTNYTNASIKCWSAQRLVVSEAKFMSFRAAILLLHFSLFDSEMLWHIFLVLVPYYGKMA